MTCQKTDYIKITEIDGKIPSINGLATIAALNTAKKKIANFNDLVNKQIMMQIHETLKLNIMAYLIVTSVQIKYSIK